MISGFVFQDSLERKVKRAKSLLPPEQCRIPLQELDQNVKVTIASAYAEGNVE